MIERRPVANAFGHLMLVAMIIIVAFPIYLAVVAASHTIQDVSQTPMPLLPGAELLTNTARALFDGPQLVGVSGATPAIVLMMNSLIMAIAIAVGKIIISLLSAFAIVYFRFPLKNFFFWMIFITLMLPVEVRIIPTYKIVADLGLLDTYTGLVLPLIASATATFLFRQFFMTVPDELVEAARIDGAGPMRFFWDILVPLTRTSIAAMFVIQFIYGWNQYLWPLLIASDYKYQTIVLAIGRLIRAPDAFYEWPVIMGMAVLALLPPVLVVVLMQRWFVKGLVETEK
ncbi:MAG: sn-glycerol-3-phosphate ABC transporter permease UgpE [Ferrovibrio sp.]|uniref:sn-glycerol-3-phosphate ABC transporter permease UgpE n=1 Tax=Ferrovibrio sp. TaxID=1917215 RepID=UPI002613B3C1|nr:sn-glycerol-3-phosphate ABC transporter permease UgpE [Ferrovibrio sp.]MCW0235165.1 sn-glycerol-3-phosphate ABC transporter permease UgpE [Ferrovibrio sp.]